MDGVPEFVQAFFVEQDVEKALQILQCWPDEALAGLASSLESITEATINLLEQRQNDWLFARLGTAYPELWDEGCHG